MTHQWRLEQPEKPFCTCRWSGTPSRHKSKLLRSRRALYSLAWRKEPAWWKEPPKKTCQDPPCLCVNACTTSEEGHTAINWIELKVQNTWMLLRGMFAPLIPFDVLISTAVLIQHVYHHMWQLALETHTSVWRDMCSAAQCSAVIVTGTTHKRAVLCFSGAAYDMRQSVSRLVAWSEIETLQCLVTAFHLGNMHQLISTFYWVAAVLSGNSFDTQTHLGFREYTCGLIISLIWCQEFAHRRQEPEKIPW